MQSSKKNNNTKIFAMIEEKLPDVIEETSEGIFDFYSCNYTNKKQTIYR